MVRKRTEPVVQWLMIAVVVFLCLLACKVISVSADAAPEPPPDGKNLAPGEETTMVQMVAEEVIIDVGATEEDLVWEGYDWYDQSGYRLAYNCTFWMVNQGDETERMAVRFPIRARYEIGVIEIQSVKVNGVAVDWWEDEIRMETDFNWAHFNVIFPPGVEVEIKVTYTSFTRLASWTNPLEEVTYVLETGAGWYGPIGKGRIILRLPYTASTKNVLPWGGIPNPQFTGTDVQWEFTNLEPKIQDNFSAGLVAPNSWAEIEAAREKLKRTPNNISALTRLAETIFSICIYDRIHTVGYLEELYPEGVEAIGKASRLSPGDVTLHLRYAWFLLADLNQDNYEALQEELAMIEALDPDNEELVSIRSSSNIVNYLEENPPTQTPTATPTLTSTPTHTSSVPTNTPTITNTPRPTKEPVQVPFRVNSTKIPEPTEVSQFTETPVSDRSDSSSSQTIIFTVMAILVVIGLVVWFIRRK